MAEMEIEVDSLSYPVKFTGGNAEVRVEPFWDSNMQETRLRVYFEGYEKTSAVFTWDGMTLRKESYL